MLKRLLFLGFHGLRNKRSESLACWSGPEVSQVRALVTKPTITVGSI